VYYGAEAAYTFYAPEFGLNHASVIYGSDFRNDIYRFSDDLKKIEGSPRVWIIVSHIYMHFGVGENRIMAAHLDRVGKQLDYYPQVGASAYLYDLQSVPSR
jgi:hypothetical protein